jgi:hypothetical protein
MDTVSQTTEKAAGLGVAAPVWCHRHGRMDFLKFLTALADGWRVRSAVYRCPDCLCLRAIPAKWSRVSEKGAS